MCDLSIQNFIKIQWKMTQNLITFAKNMTNFKKKVARKISLLTNDVPSWVGFIQIKQEDVSNTHACDSYLSSQTTRVIIINRRSAQTDTRCFNATTNTFQKWQMKLYLFFEKTAENQLNVRFWISIQFGSNDSGHFWL